MLQEILSINGNICDFEKKFGVLFSRQTALVRVYAFITDGMGEKYNFIKQKNYRLGCWFGA